MRARKIRKFVGLEESALHVASDQQQSLEFAETQGRVRAAMEKLPEKHKKVLMLAHFSEMNHAMIARTLDIPIGTVASRLNRALTKMGVLLGDSK